MGALHSVDASESGVQEHEERLGIRPIYHQLQHRAEAHIFVVFLSYCLQITSNNQIAAHAPGVTPRAVLDKLAGIQMLDVWLPTTDGRFLVMPRHTEPDHQQALLLHQLGLQLPPQPPPRIRAKAAGVAPAPLKM